MSIASIKVQPMPVTQLTGDTIPTVDEKTWQKFEKIAIRRLVQKLDWRLIPFIFLLEVASYINRMNIGNATLMGIGSDLNLSQSESNWSISLVFLAYLIFEIPTTILMRYLGPTRYLSLSMLAWCSTGVGMAFVRNARELLAIRFLVGMFNAGFFPSMTVYLSVWYRRKDQTMRIAILFEAVITSSALSGILAYTSTYMNDIGGLNGWQWMFLLGSLPLIPLVIIICLFVSNIPDTVQWLDNSEKQLLTNLLRNEEGIANCQNAQLSWRQVLYVFIDWRIYLYALISIGNLGVMKYLTTYLPLLMQGIGRSEADVYLMTVPPYVFAFVFCLLANYSSSQRNEHGIHLIICLSVALLGFILILTLIDRGKAALYVSTCIACCGLFSAFPLILSWLTNNVRGHTKKPIAVGFVISLGQIGGIISPFIPNNQLTNQRNIFICIGVMVATLAITILLRIHLVLENRRRDHLSNEKYDREAAIKEPCDWHPQIRYVL